MHANNETGAIQPVSAIAEIAHAHGARSRTSTRCSRRASCRLDVRALGVDLLSISGHKFYGPKGAGALWVRRGTRLVAQMTGGRQERSRRAGTENVPAIVGLGAAAARAATALEHDAAHAARLRDRLEQGVLATVEGTAVNAARCAARRQHDQHQLRSHRGGVAAHRARSRGHCRVDGLGVLVGHARAVARVEGDGAAARTLAEFAALQPRRADDRRGNRSRAGRAARPRGEAPRVDARAGHAVMIAASAIPTRATRPLAPDAGRRPAPLEAALQSRSPSARPCPVRGRPAPRVLLMSRVVVAMSGGVDSSVAAALLVERGDDVVGVSMQLYDQREGGSGEGFGSCCTIDDLQDARRVAVSLGVPHYIMNFERQFAEKVVDNFVAEYAAGRTPLPCARCNADLKFATLLERARMLGAEVVATGHYARITSDASGRFELRRGLDAGKDQSYFLFSLDQSQLSRRAVPGRRADQARSAGSRPTARSACRRQARQPGDLLRARRRLRRVRRAAKRRRPRETSSHVDGTTLGRHAGVHRFTVGQRKGLGLSAGRPLYVVAVEPQRPHHHRGTGRGARGAGRGRGRRQLDVRGCAGRPDSRGRPDPPPPSARRRDGHAAPRSPCARRVRRAAARGHARPGGRVLR